MVTLSRQRWSIATACLLLAACANAPQKQSATPSSNPPATVDVPILDSLKPAPVEVPFAPPPELPLAPIAVSSSPWDRLRLRLAMPGCEYSPAVQHWAQTYTQGPERFAATLKRALPFLMLVLDELERQDLPGEFALLPYLESHYEPINSRGDTPAGMWQMIPDTARSAGLSVNSEYDGRLDAWASSAAAVGLLKRYQDEFNDWRLVDMAFNAGEFRVKKLLRNGSGELDRDALARLSLSPTTHEHLAKLLALGCIIHDPSRFGVTLPEPDSSDRLVRVPLEAPIDIRMAARLADVPEDLLKRYNAGHRQSRMAKNAPLYLLLPEAAAPRFRKRYEKLSAGAWSTWQSVRLRQPRGVAELAEQAAVPIEMVSAANGVADDRSFAAGSSVFLPEAIGAKLGDATASITRSPAPSAIKNAGDSVARQSVVVKSGDNLWTLARRHHVSVADLKRWNLLSDGGALQPGQRLRLEPEHGVD